MANKIIFVKDAYLRAVCNDTKHMIPVNIRYNLSYNLEIDFIKENNCYRLSSKDERRTFYIYKSEIYNYNHFANNWFRWDESE